MVPGVVVNLRGVEYTLTPLTLAQLRDGGAADIITVQDCLSKRDILAPAFLEAVARLVHQSIQANHPAVKLEEVSGLIDLKNWLEAWKAIHGISLPKVGEAEGGA
jgi:hypothetical protein